MRLEKKALHLAIVLALYLPTGAQVIAADAGTCHTITDPDYRTLCRAKAHKDSGICYAIQRNDLRSMCLAETR